MLRAGPQTGPAAAAPGNATTRVRARTRHAWEGVLDVRGQRSYLWLAAPPSIPSPSISAMKLLGLAGVGVCRVTLYQTAQYRGVLWCAVTHHVCMVEQGSSKDYRARRLAAILLGSTDLQARIKGCDPSLTSCFRCRHFPSACPHNAAGARKRCARA